MSRPARGVTSPQRLRGPGGRRRAVYVRALVARVGQLGPEADVWLRQCGSLAVDLDRLSGDADAIRVKLAETDVSPRMAARYAKQLRSLARQMADTRSNLGRTEQHVASLAKPRPKPTRDELILAAQQSMEDHAERLRRGEKVDDDG